MSEPTRTTPGDGAPPAAHAHAHAEADVHGHGDAHEIHLPPNSWIPVALSLTLTATMIGFTVGAWLWVSGLVLTAVCLGGWYTAARSEYEELPD